MKYVIRGLLILSATLGLTACFQNAVVESSGGSFGLGISFDSSDTDTATYAVYSNSESITVSGSCSLLSDSIEVSANGTDWVAPDAGSTNTTCTGGVFSIVFSRALVATNWQTDWGFASFGDSTQFFIHTTGTLGTSAQAVLTVEYADKPTVNFVGTNSSSNEDVATHYIVLNLDFSTASDVIVTLNTPTGTATGGGTDYTLAGLTFTIVAGQTSASIPISVVNDTTGESSETVNLSIASTSANAVLGSSSTYSYTINANDMPNVIFSSSNVTSAAENIAGGTVNVIIELDNPSAGAISVDPVIVGGTASGSGTDYTFSAGTILFLANETSKTVTLSLNDDSIYEDTNETIQIGLTNLTGDAIYSGGLHTVTITENDPKPNISLSAATGTVNEATGTIALNIQIDRAANANVTINYATTNGSALSGVGNDYTAASGTLTVLTGNTVANVTLTILNNSTIELDENFSFSISTPSVNAVLVSPIVATITINDDDITAHTWTGAAADMSWSNASNWYGSAAPAASDKAIFTNATCGSNCNVNIGGIANIGGLLMMSDYTGTITQSATVAIGSQGLQIDGGTFVGHSTIALDLNGNFVQNSGNLTLAGADLQVGASFTHAGGTLTLSTSKVIFDSATAATITPGALSFNDVDLVKTATLTVSGTLEINGDLNVNMSTANILTGTLRLSGDLNWLSSGAASTSQIEFFGSNNQLITRTGGTWPNSLTTVNKSVGLITQLSNLNLNNSDLDLQSGIWNMDGFSLTGIDVLSTATGTKIYQDCGTLTYTTHSPSNGLVTANTMGVTLSITDPAAVTEGGSQAFVISASPVNCSALNFNYATNHGTTDSSDLTSLSATSSIPANTSSLTITVNTTLDTKYEGGSEYYTFDLTSVAAGVLGDFNGQATINDDDTQPTLGFAATTSSVSETISSQNIVINLSNASYQTITANYALSGSATGSGTDYTLTAGTVSFSPNELSKTLVVSLTNDTTPELDETLIVTLGSPVNTTFAPGFNVHTLTITSEDEIPLSHFTVTGATDPIAAGTNVSVTVTAYNTFSQVKTDYTGTIEFISDDTLATLPSNYTFVGGDAGAHTFTNEFTLRTAGEMYIKARDTLDTAKFGQQSNITVNPGALDHFNVSGISDPTNVESLNSLTVIAADAFNNTKTDYTGTILFTSDASFLTSPPASYAFIGADAGQKSFDIVFANTGTYFISVDDGPFAGQQSNIDVNASLKARLTSASATANSFDAFTVTAAFVDDFNTNSTATAYYCNSTDSPSCDPLAGNSVALSKTGLVLNAAVTALISPYDPGDEIKVVVEISDTDGVHDDDSITDDGKILVTSSPRLKARVDITPATITPNPGEWGVAKGTVQVQSSYSGHYPLTVELSTASGTASQYNDYWPLTNEPMTFQVSDPLTRNFAVPIYSNTVKQTSSRMITVSGSLSGASATNATINSSANASTFTITDNDNDPKLDISQMVFSLGVGPDRGFACMIEGGAKNLRCWGSDANGQLGDGAFTVTGQILTKPANIIATNVTQVALGAQYGCALIGTGSAAEVKCWGFNNSYQLGIGNTTTQFEPVTATIPANSTPYPVQIATADDAACAVMSDSSVKCWGRNNYGQVGDGSIIDRSVPTAVQTSMTPTFLIGVDVAGKSIVAGAGHFCVRKTDNSVVCWGQNTNGQLGDNTTTNKSFATAIPLNGSSSSTQAIELSAGMNHTCAITAANEVRCWGYNVNGQIGDGTITNRLAPVLVSPAFSGALSLLASGRSHNCVKDSSGVKCWGRNDSYQLGDGTGTNQISAKLVSQPSQSATEVSQIFAGAYNTCFKYGSGAKINQTHCIGENNNGQLSRNELAYQITPVDVSLNSNSEQLENISHSLFATQTYLNFSCAIIKGSNNVYCWGANNYGQLGNNDVTTKMARNTPVQAGSLTATQISTGSTHACAVTTTGALYCWGFNSNSQLGNGGSTTQYSPIVIDSGINYSKVSAGNTHTCGITASGTLKCWGANSSGQLGDGTNSLRTAPVIIDSGTTYSQVSAGHQHTCAITTSGALKCWGSNLNYQLGDGTNTQKTTPVTIDSGTSYTKVIAGHFHTCALTNAGNMKCWGYNAFGQIGIGTGGSQVQTPSFVLNSSNTNLENVIDIAIGSIHSCAVVSTGAVYCWGSNDQGQAGHVDGFNAISRYADLKAVLPVSQLSAGVKKVIAGGDTSCAILFNDRAKCWGANYFGNLGNKNSIGYAEPVVGP